MNRPTYYDLVGFSHSRTPTQSADLIATPDLAGTAIFLDFDGTLVPIAASPDAISVPPDLPKLLARLMDATGGATALVSGRSCGNLREFLPGFQGPIIGCHGAEEDCEGKIDPHPLAGSDIVENMGRMAIRFAETIEGLEAETKPLGVALHFRQAPEAADPALKFMRSLSECWPDFELHTAKMAYELRPAGVCKDAAVARWMDRVPFAGRRPVYLGDDTTDEGALAFVRDAGGIAIKVGDGETSADYLIAQEEVLPLLEGWLGKDT